MYDPENLHPENIIAHFCVAGINYEDAAATERSAFAVTAASEAALFAEAKQLGLHGFFILSTCNRSELYGYCRDENILSQLLLKHTEGTQSVFERSGFIKKGVEALEYLFTVASGLQSQIKGDYEITGQLRTAVSHARKHGLIGAFMDRTVNFALQASKAVRTRTKLSTGTVSVSYAAIEWLKQLQRVDQKSVLMIGAGHLAASVIKNLRHYLGIRQITVTNRTDANAEKLAAETGIAYCSFDSLNNAVAAADIIILCTNAPAPILLPAHIGGDKQHYIIDLSVPENVHPAVGQMKGITLAGIDDVSRIMESTFTKRNAEIPAAIAIVQEHLLEFYSWLSHYRYVPAMNRVKDRLYDLSIHHYIATTNEPAAILDSKVEKTVGLLAANLRHRDEKGCECINAFNHFLTEINGNG